MAEGRADVLPWVDEAHVRALEQRIAARKGDLVADDLHGHRYTAGIAETLLTTSQRYGAEEVTFGGQIVGDLTLSGTCRTVRITDLEGNLEVAERGHVHVLWIAGVINGYVTTSPGSKVDHLSVGDLSLAGAVSDHVHIAVESEITTFSVRPGSIASAVLVGGSVAGSMHLSGLVTSINLAPTGRVGDAYIETHQRGAGARGPVTVVLDGRVTGNLSLSLPPGSLISLKAAVQGLTSIGATESRINLVTINGARFRDEVAVGEFVSIEECDFRNCPDLHQFSLIGSFTSLFPAGQGLINEEMAKSPNELASVNRQLRANLEGRKNRPAASMFYKGEMNARRKAALLAKPERKAEWFILAMYRALSGYGLVAWRPIVWFVGIVIAGSTFFARTGLTLEVTDSGDEVMASVAEIVVFTVRSMIAFFNPSEGVPTVGQAWVQIALRFAGPILLAQVILAVRERVAR